MKILILVIILSSILTMSCHAQEKSNEIINEEIDTAQDSAEVGWAKDVDGLIEHLNSWYKDELESYERPAVNSNRKTSGETNGWIGEHKRLLKELEATVIWNKEERKYELKKDIVQLIDTNERKKTKVQLDGIEDHPNKEDMEWFLNNYKEEFIAADVDWKAPKHEGLIQKGYNFRTKSSNISLILLFCKDQQDALIIAKANFPIIDGLQKSGVNGGVLFVAQGDDQYNVRDILAWFAGEE